jgi:hypothetical protein
MRLSYWLAAVAVLAICGSAEASAPRPYILTHLGELPGNTASISAADINSHGDIVGQSVSVGGGTQGFIGLRSRQTAI